MKTNTIDPRGFISGPYIKCPKCGKDSFGILSIHDNHYSRRCKKCLFPNRTESGGGFPLPELNKKIIYIDQFAISNMMKALNPQTKTYKEGTLDEFWIRVFDRLARLCKLQLIICPFSGFHTNESLLSPYFEHLKRMYELLSYGISFYNHKKIKISQIYNHAKNWISGEGEKLLNLDVHSVVHGKINAWQDRVLISMNWQYDIDCIDNLRKTREKTHKEFSEIFKRWQSEKNKTFDDWFEEESMGFGRAIIRNYLSYEKRIEEIFKGDIEITEKNMNVLFPPLSAGIIDSIHDAFRKRGIKNSDIWPKTFEYLTSPSLKDVPFLKIYSMLVASIARKAAAGRKKPPNQGMANDIEIISVLLPYCDAMFIDNECHNYLKEQPLCDAIDYGTVFYSQKTKDEFLNYLDEIELKTTKGHFEKVDEVYGKSWRKPYKTIYVENR